MMGSLSSIAVTLVLVLAGGCAGTRVDEATHEAGLDLEATRQLLDWLTAKKQIIGYDSPPGTGWAVERADRLLVLCDYLDDELALSDDPRVARHTSAEIEQAFDRYGYDKTVYVWLTEIGRTARTRIIRLKYAFGNAGGHTYEFEFRRVDGQLQAKGRLTGSA